MLHIRGGTLLQLRPKKWCLLHQKVMTDRQCEYYTLPAHARLGLKISYHLALLSKIKKPTYTCIPTYICTQQDYKDPSNKISGRIFPKDPESQTPTLNDTKTSPTKTANTTNWQSPPHHTILPYSAKVKSPPPPCRHTCTLQDCTRIPPTTAYVQLLTTRIQQWPPC